MSDPVEDERLQNREAFIATLQPIVSKFDAERNAIAAAREALGSRLETNLQYLESHRKNEYDFALKFFAKTVTQAAVTLAKGKIYMSEEAAKQYRGVSPDHILHKGKRHKASHIDKQFVDDEPDRVLSYSLNGIPVMVENVQTHESRLIVPAFSAILSRVVEGNQLQLTFDLCQMVRDHDPLPTDFPLDYVQIAE